MSNVTTVVLTFGTLEDDKARLENVNRYLESECSAGLVDIGPHSGGTKAHQVTVATGAFKHLDLAGFVSAIEAIPWCDHRNVALFVNREHESHMHPVTLWGGKHKPETGCYEDFNE